MGCAIRADAGRLFFGKDSEVAHQLLRPIEPVDGDDFGREHGRGDFAESDDRVKLVRHGQRPIAFDQ